MAQADPPFGHFADQRRLPGKQFFLAVALGVEKKTVALFNRGNVIGLARPEKSGAEGVGLDFGLPKLAPLCFGIATAADIVIVHAIVIAPIGGIIPFSPFTNPPDMPRR